MEPPTEDYHHHPHPHHYHHHTNHPEQHHPNYFQNQLQPPLPPQPQPPLPPQSQLQPQPQHHYFNRHDHFAEQNQFNNQNLNLHSNFDANHQRMNAESNESFGGGFFSNGRKRGRYFSGRPGSPDHNLDAASVKLFVAPVPIPTTIENICPLFEAHGSIVEVILPRDRRSGQQQGYCFVKYATIEEADRAIRALNGQYTIPGEVHPLKVRYADRERERLCKVVDKLYVGCINKQASKQEIEEIFSPYGHVEDVYIVRDNLKQSRGCAFVKLPDRDKAVAAIKALHGTFTMRGCDQPLIVKFADPKKRRAGELRGNIPFSGQNFGPCSQEPMNRPIPNFCDSMAGGVLPNASYPMHETPTNSQPLAITNTLAHSAPQTITQPLSPVKQPPLQLYQMPLQQTQGPQNLMQSSQETVTEMMKQTQNVEQQQSVQIPLESPCSGGHPPAVNDTSADSLVPPSHQTEDPQECDWSEHSCPDGYKYYYNCMTLESRWEKPDEFILFQQQLQKQQNAQSSSRQSYSLSTGFSVEEADRTPSIKYSTSTSLPVDVEPMQIQSEASLVVDPTCV
ncbi:RNA binding protein, putative [Ricinus communis]|uniref:RNA binding protein, putative n=1 Tax=Ricinus communis TaxID=3988 RepID=B9RNB1_RICCO|nr:RNA binding protein, putative [Ricinus communis]